MRTFLQSNWRHNTLRRLAMLYAALWSDYLFINFSTVDLAVFAVLLRLVPFHRCKLVVLDLFLEPHSKASRRAVLRALLRQVNLFLVYVKDVSRYQKEYALSSSVFRYVPFKVNMRSEVMGAPVSDDGYIFSGGRSRRDFRTFFEAVAPLGYPVKVVASDEATLNEHGSSLSECSIPGNVDLIRPEVPPREFIRLMAAARLVVIPIKKDVVTQAGIAVYLTAMALKKCVIISSGPGVSDVLLGDEAVIAEAGNVHALREAIERAWKDRAWRTHYAENGYRYVLSLGDDTQFRRSLLTSLLARHPDIERRCS